MNHEMLIHKFASEIEAERTREALEQALKTMNVYIRHMDTHPYLCVGSNRPISATTARMTRAFMLGYNAGIKNAQPEGEKSAEK